VVGGFVVSLLIHLLIVASVAIGTITQAAAVEEETKVVMAPFEPVELVRLGEKKPKNALPRIANPAPDTDPEDVVNLAEKEPKPEDVVLEKEEPKEKKKVEERKDRMKDILSGAYNPNRPTNTDIAEGDPDGVPEGTTSDVAMMRLMNTYAAKVIRDITREWNVPSTLSQSQAKDLAGKISVQVYLSPEGYVVRYTLTRRSGNGQFDISVERAIKAFTVMGGRKLSMPNDENLKTLVLKKGLNLRRWEYVGN
jgi:outer membrane biosynthesis protein TonB